MTEIECGLGNDRTQLWPEVTGSYYVGLCPALRPLCGLGMRGQDQSFGPPRLTVTGPTGAEAVDSQHSVLQDSVCQATVMARQMHVVMQRPPP